MVNQVTYGYKSYRLQGPRIWKFLPNAIKEIKSFYNFKKQLKNLIIPFCSRKNCLTSQLANNHSSSLVDNMLQYILLHK